MSYLTYNGKLIKSDNKFASFFVSPELIISWENYPSSFGFTTFISDENNIISAIETGVSGGAATNIVPLINGDKILININIDLNSGTMPALQLLSDFDDQTYVLVNGLNSFEYDVTQNGNFYLHFTAESPTNFSALCSMKKE